MILAEVERYHAHTERYLRVFEALFEHRDVADGEHVLLVDAVRAGRIDLSVEILREHIMAISRMVGEYMEGTRGAT